MTTIALLGAGGKMGCRITDNLLKTNYSVKYAEVSDKGRTAITALLAARAADTQKLAKAA